MASFLSQGKVITVPAVPKPTTLAAYEKRIQTVWDAERIGAITLEHAMSRTRFLRAERDRLRRYD